MSKLDQYVFVFGVKLVKGTFKEFIIIVI